VAELLNNYYLQIFTFIGINALLSLSVYLVLSTGQLTLGNAGFLSLGAFTTALLATKAGWPWWINIPLGGLAAAVVAVGLGFATLRLRGIYLAIATLGFTETIRVLWVNLPYTGGSLGIRNIPNINKLFQRFIQTQFDEAPLGLSFSQLANLTVMLGVWLVVTLTLLFIIRQGKSRVGRAYTAIRTDEVAAGAMGVDVVHYKVLAFAQGAFLAGVAGGLTAHTTFAIAPADFAFNKAVEMLTYVVVGGSGVAFGPVLGATALIFMSESLRDLRILGERMSDYRLIIYGVLMMVIMVIRPQGILTPGLFKFRGPAVPSDEQAGVRKERRVRRKGVPS
jgi:branched-chain amino acid transport system permease protein